MRDPLAPVPSHIPPERIVDVDIYRMPGVDRDLHAGWKQLQESSPFGLLWTRRNGGHWIVTRGKDISRIYADHANFSSNITIVPREIGEQYPLRPTTLDPPDHQPFRKLIGAALSKKVIQTAEPRIREFVRNAIERRRMDGRCEFIREIAEPIPSAVFMYLADLPQSYAGKLPRYGEEPDALDTPLMQRYANFLRPLIAERQRHPGNDLLSNLACGSIENRPISEDEAVEISTAVLTGGLDTVISAAGLMIAFLARNPTHRQRLIRDPNALYPAVAEMLRRFPLMTKARLLKQDQQIEGIRLKAGDMIVLPPLHGLDEEEFDDPMRVDFERPPGPDSVFGNGVHHCPGHLLAQMELAILIDEWLRAIPDFEIDPQHPPRMRGGILGAMLELDLQWDPSTTCCTDSTGQTA